MENEKKRRIKDEEDVLLICSPSAEKILRESGVQGVMVIAPWVEETSCIVVRHKDWESMIDNGETWGLAEE